MGFGAGRSWKLPKRATLGLCVRFLTLSWVLPWGRQHRRSSCSALASGSASPSSKSSVPVARAALAVFLATPSATRATHGHAEQPTGEVTPVRDGATTELRCMAIRLQASFAPELDEYGGTMRAPALTRRRAAPPTSWVAAAPAAPASTPDSYSRRGSLRRCPAPARQAAGFGSRSSC